MTDGHGVRTGVGVSRVFVAAAVLVVIATALHVVLSRTIVVVGPFSTLGLPAAAYLLASWCLAGGLVLLLARTRSEGMGLVGGVVACGIVLLAVAVTNVLGQAAVSSATTPMFTYPAGSDGTILLRLGDGVRDGSLTVFRGDERTFELVDVTFPSPDARAFASGHRVTEGPDGEDVVTYRDRGGRFVDVVLPR